MNFVQKFFAASTLVWGLNAQAECELKLEGEQIKIGAGEQKVSIPNQIAAELAARCNNGFTGGTGGGGPTDPGGPGEPGSCDDSSSVAMTITHPESKGGIRPVGNVFKGGSKIDAMTYNFIHSVTDISLAGPGGCSSCGSAAPKGSLPEVGFTQIFSSRDQGGSLGDRQCNLDITLSCFTLADGTRAIDSHNPALLGKRRLKLSGSSFIDTTYQASKGVKLYTAANALTTDFASASTAVMTLKDGSAVTFELFLDQDNADPLLRSYTGRLLSVRDKAGHGFSLSYLDAANSSATPLEKRRFASLADSKGQQLDFTWTASLVYGRFAVHSVSGCGQSVSYRYQDNKFAGADYADGSQSSVTWSLTASGLTKGSFFEPRLPAMDRSKEVIFTSASQAFLDSHDDDGVAHYNSASMLCLAAAKNGEVTFAVIPSNQTSQRKLLVEGELLEVRDGRISKFNSWSYEPAASNLSLSEAFVGTQDKYSTQNPWQTLSNAQGRPSMLQKNDGTQVKYYYSADGSVRSILHPDGSFERFVYDADKNLVLHQDRIGNISKFTYDAQNNKTSHTSGWAMRRVYDVDATAPGLKVSSYATPTTGTTLPDFSTLTPYAVERILDFSLPGVIALDYFGCVYEGDIDIPAAGDYSFFLKANTGAKLFLDGQEIAVSNSTETASAPLALTPGKHAVKLCYYETNGAESLSLKWQGPGIAKQSVPSSVLSHTVVQQEVEAVATAEAASESWEYYPAGHPNQFMLKSHTDFKGVTDQILTYDANNRVIKVEEINDAGTGYIAKQVMTYGADGQVATVTDANARTTSFFRDSMGRLFRTVYYDGSSEETFFGTSGNEAGLVVKTKDRSGATTTYAHDANGRSIQTIRGYSIIDANGTETVQAASAQSVESCTYLNASNLKTSCLRDGELTEYEYDSQLRLVASKTWVSASKSLVSSSSYLEGKLFSTTDAYGRKSYNLYRSSDSALIRQVQELVPGGAGSITSFGQIAMLQRDLGLNPAYTVVDTELDAAGNPLASIDAKGVRSESVQDSRGRSIRSLQAVAMQPFYKSSSYADLDLANTLITIGGTFGQTHIAATPKLIDSSVAGQITFWAVGHDGSNTKAIKIVLTPKADGGIKAEVVAAKFISGVNLDFDFNSGGTVTSVASNPAGNGYTYSNITYASKGPASTPTGIAVTSEQDYDLNGNVIEVRHPRFFSEGIPAKTRYTYSARGKELSTIAADGSVTSQTYHDDGRLATSTDALGFVTTSEWPTCCNNSVVTTDPTDVAQITNNDAVGRTTHQVVKRDASTCHCSANDPAGALTMSETTRRYDARGRVIASTTWLAPLGYVDPNNAPIAEDPAQGLTTRYRYFDSVLDFPELAPTLAKLSGISFASGSADGSATLVTNPAGERSLVIQDGAGRTLIQAQLGANYEPVTWSTATYDTIVAGLLESSQTDALGNTSKSRSDAAGRTRIAIDAAGNSSTAFFDANGNLVQYRDALNHGQDCAYDALNRRTSCADTQELAEGKSRSTTYNASGAVLTQVDTKGAVTSNSYDLRDQLVAITERNTGVVAFAYDAKGQRTSVTDQLGKVTSYQFNPRGELIKTINADASVDETVFDALGRKIKVIHPGGNSAVMAYDLASRLLSRNYFAAGSGIAESTDSFTYDLASRPVTASNADAQISYTYDSIGRRSSLTQTLDGLAKTVNFVYDAANRLLSRSPEGLAVESRSFTNRGQLASVSLEAPGTAGVPPALVASFSYDAAGRETSRTYGNGLNTTSSYSRADNLITSITVANKPELSFNYSYDSNKNVTAEQRGGFMALYSWSATFDNMDRLNSQNDGVQTRSWNLDLVGNTTSETLNGTAEARTLNAMHAPTAAGNKAYTYDNNGQMTQKPQVSFTWDARNHLSHSSHASHPSHASVAYRYDAFGNRVSKGSTRYLLVDNQVVAEFANGEAKQYCYGAYIDEVLAEKGADVSYCHRNRQYNTSALTDSSGAVLEMYSTDAMGRVKAFDAVGSAKAAPTATTVLFTGRILDAETGLYYFRARYFEPELGVFISRDPLGFVDGMSVYLGYFAVYFNLDPSGLCTPPKNCDKEELEFMRAGDAALAAKAVARTAFQAMQEKRTALENMLVDIALQRMTADAATQNEILAVNLAAAAAAAVIVTCRRADRRLCREAIAAAAAAATAAALAEQTTQLEIMKLRVLINRGNQALVEFNNSVAVAEATRADYFRKDAAAQAAFEAWQKCLKGGG